MLNIIAVSPLISLSFILFWQIYNFDKGDNYFKNGQYVKSIQYYKKGTETWHLPFKFADEVAVFDRMAEAYCQLEDFNKAREIYLLVCQRYSDWKTSASENIELLDVGLQKVKEYESLPADKKNDIYVLYGLAVSYQYLHCDAKALEIYTKIAAMPVDDKSKELAKKEIQELTTKENK